MLPAETNRQFTATQPNQLWVAEITFATTWVDFVYVAFVIDVFFCTTHCWLAGCQHDAHATRWAGVKSGRFP
jgi:transposase InsO family protein